jgi:hypothetical protein
VDQETTGADAEALAAWQAAAAHVDRHELAAAELLLSPWAGRDDAEARLAALPFGDDPAGRDLSQAALEQAMIARDRGDRATAVAMLEQAVLPLDADRDPSPASIAHYHLAYQLILDDRVDEARDHAVVAFTLAEEAGRRLAAPDDRESFYRDQRQTYVLAMHCAARAGDGLAAFTVATSARAEALSAFVRSGARLGDGLRELVDAATLARGAPEEVALYRPAGHRGSTRCG